MRVREPHATAFFAFASASLTDPSRLPAPAPTLHACMPCAHFTQGTCSWKVNQERGWGSCRRSSRGRGSFAAAHADHLQCQRSCGLTCFRVP